MIINTVSPETLGNRYYYLYSTDEEGEAQGDQII